VAIVAVVIADLLNLGNNFAVEHGHKRAVVGRFLEHDTLLVQQIALGLEKVP
jgi:hypothetical protein